MPEQHSDQQGTAIYCQTCILPLITNERVYYTPEFVLTKEDDSPVGSIELHSKKGINIRLVGQDATPLVERYLYSSYQAVERDVPTLTATIFQHIEEAQTLLK